MRKILVRLFYLDYANEKSITYYTEHEKITSITIGVFRILFQKLRKVIIIKKVVFPAQIIEGINIKIRNLSNTDGMFKCYLIKKKETMAIIRFIYFFISTYKMYIKYLVSFDGYTHM